MLLQSGSTFSVHGRVYIFTQLGAIPKSASTSPISLVSVSEQVDVARSGNQSSTELVVSEPLTASLVNRMSFAEEEGNSEKAGPPSPRNMLPPSPRTRRPSALSLFSLPFEPLAEGDEEEQLGSDCHKPRRNGTPDFKLSLKIFHFYFSVPSQDSSQMRLSTVKNFAETFKDADNQHSALVKASCSNSLSPSVSESHTPSRVTTPNKSLSNTSPKSSAPVKIECMYADLNQKESPPSNHYRLAESTTEVDAPVKYVGNESIYSAKALTLVAPSEREVSPKSNTPAKSAVPSDHTPTQGITSFKLETLTKAANWTESEKAAEPPDSSDTLAKVETLSNTATFAEPDAQVNADGRVNTLPSESTEECTEVSLALYETARSIFENFETLAEECEDEVPDNANY